MSGIFSAPLLFTPIFKEKIWGGSALREKLRKNAPADRPIGESWELSGWGDSQTRVSSGEHAGLTLGELFTCDQAGLIGTSEQCKNSFPLLFKFIDAKENLSIQVHPTGTQSRARGWGERGKTEVWYIVDAAPDARIALGFNRDGITSEEAETAVKNGDFESLLNIIPAKSGDTFFIPAGTVHAILGGVLVYEIQEESNTTLRLYDWNRVCPRGFPRELHISDALGIIKFDECRPLKPEPILIEKNDFYIFESLCNNSKFILSRYRFSKTGSASLGTTDGFRVISVTAGSAAVCAGGNCMPLDLGKTVLVPSLLEDTKISGETGTDVLVTMCTAGFRPS
jgi:mannose-6-phosphate isomerase